MRIYLLIIMSAMLLNCCSMKTKKNNDLMNLFNPEDTIMTGMENVKAEYYDFQTTQNGTRSLAYERGDGWLVELWEMKNMSFGGCVEFAPASDFYEIYKEYYPNGVIKQRVKLMSGIAFGRREIFDESGVCTMIVDEDRKFGKLKWQDIVRFLEEEGWFNRRTGENLITDSFRLPTNYTLYREMMRYMRITFKRAVKDSNGNETEPPKWFIEIEPRFDMHITRYVINGNTGEFEKKETYEFRGE